MKKITLLLLFLSSIVYSQDEPLGTTLEEYNYMIKGYPISISSGLDVKKGYIIENITQYNVDSYEFQFKSLLRESSNTLAGIIVIATSKVWGNKYYFGIPLSNKELDKDFKLKLSTWDKPMLTAYASASSNLMLNYYTIYVLNKTSKKPENKKK